MFAINGLELELGRTDTVEMNIVTGNHLPVYTKPYPSPLKYKEVIQKAVGDMLEARVIERAPLFQWNSPIVMKTTGKKGLHRYSCDFRKLNKITPVAYQMTMWTSRALSVWSKSALRGSSHDKSEDGTI